MCLASALKIADRGHFICPYSNATKGNIDLYGTGSNPNSVYHQAYTTQNDTYVQPHYQTAPNNTQFDNYSTRGNYNPYTGNYGTRSPRW